jgi:uncharacterized protein with GYD domain
MKRLLTLSATTMLPWCLPLALPSAVVWAQQATHTYLVRAVLTTEGVRNLQKQPPTALKAAVAKFDESVGGKLLFWYFDYAESSAYSIVEFPNEIAAATVQAAANAGGFARVTFRPVLSAEEMDKALAKANAIRVPQQQ